MKVFIFLHTFHWSSKFLIFTKPFLNSLMILATIASWCLIIICSLAFWLLKVKWANSISNMHLESSLMDRWMFIWKTSCKGVSCSSCCDLKFHMTFKKLLCNKNKNIWNSKNLDSMGSCITFSPNHTTTTSWLMWRTTLGYCDMQGSWSSTSFGQMCIEFKLQLFVKNQCFNSSITII